MLTAEEIIEEVLYKLRNTLLKVKESDIEESKLKIMLIISKDLKQIIVNDDKERKKWLNGKDIDKTMFGMEVITAEENNLIKVVACIKEIG